MFEIKPLQGEKQEIYPRILEQDKSLIEDEKDWLVNLANTSLAFISFLGSCELGWILSI
ncbi:hypothetical protein HK1_00718 [Tepidibacillus sp. HK-1]|nr:hypothetical protein HK1_00718 [Tepidibacillus sp. HK-1]